MLATVVFTDICNSTDRAVRLGDRRWRDLLARHHALVRDQLARFRGQEVDTAGDGFFATFDGPGRAVRCACAIRDGVRDLGIEVRAGVHTGEVLVSSTVKDLASGAAIAFAARGGHVLKGIPGEWQLFGVVGDAAR